MGGVALADSTCPSGQFLRAFAYPSSTTCAAPSVAIGLTLPALSQPGVSGSTQNTTGTIAANSNILNLDNALDFASGQGIDIEHVGPSYTLGAPASCSVSQIGTGGSTTYIYQVSAFDPKKGISAYVQCSTTTGNATQSVANHNLVTISAVSGRGGYLIWGAAGSTGFLGASSQLTFADYGNGGQPLPLWVPATAPLASLPQALVTTIQSGGGTLKLTLGNSATNAASATHAVIQHDDLPALQAALTLAESLNIDLGLNSNFMLSGPLKACTAVGTCTARLGIVGTGEFTSILRPLFPTQDVIDDNSVFPASFAGFGVIGGDLGAMFQTAGSGISVSNTGHVGDNYFQLSGNQLYDGLTLGIGFNVKTVDIINARYSFSMPNGAGDSSFEDVEASPESITGENAEGFNGLGPMAGNRITNFKCLSGVYYRCIDYVITGANDTGLYIGGSWSIEGFTDRAIWLSHSGGTTWTAIQITGSGEINGSTGIETQSDGTNWVHGLRVSGIFFGGVTNAIKVGGVDGVSIQDNTFFDTTTGVVTDGHTSLCTITNNTWDTITTQLTDGTSGGCNLVPSNALTADVNLTTATQYFLGPSFSIAGGGYSNLVTWNVKSTITLTDTAGAAKFTCALSDGVSFFGAGTTQIAGANQIGTISLSANIVTTGTSIGTYCTDDTSNSGIMKFNVSGFSKDSIISGTRRQL